MWSWWLSADMAMKRDLQEIVEKKQTNKTFEKEIYALETIILIDLLPGLLAFHSSQTLLKKHCTVVSVYSDWPVSIFSFHKGFFPELDSGFI